MLDRVPRSTHQRANAVADALGITRAAYVALLIERDQLDERGRPVWARDIDGQRSSERCAQSAEAPTNAA